VKNAKFDMRPLLASTDSIFASLIHAFSWYVHNFVSNLHMDGYSLTSHVFGTSLMAMLFLMAS